MTDTRQPPVDRRKPSAELLMLVQEVRGHQLEMREKLDNVPQEIAQALAVLMKDAFPDGDAAGHRKHHEAAIKAAESRAAFWGKLYFELAKYGLIGFAVWAFWTLGSAALAYLQQRPHV